MLTVLGSQKRTCQGFTRRDALQAGGLGVLAAAGLPVLASGTGEFRRRNRPGRAKSVIVLYLLGGAPTQDMIDLKPDAPSEIAGEFRPINTTVPGVHVCEHLPRMSRWMHKIAQVRSLNHRAGCHNPLPSYTGFELPLPDIVTTRDTYPPSMGSVCEYLRQGEASLPDYVYMPCYLGWGQAIRRPGPYAGFLGQRYDPLITECSPSRAPGGPTPAPGRPVTVLGDPRIPDSILAQEVTLDRLSRRRSLLQQVDDRRRQIDYAGAHHMRTQTRAFDLLSSDRVRAAFDLDREDARIRDRYGRTLFGNCALIARRMVEAGVRFINVTWDLFWDRVPINYDAWDTHTRNFPILKECNLPEFDQTYSALLQDLDGRGLLDETLVVVMSEMGRTPRINANGGRDHWTYCYSTWFAGGGTRGGSVYGASDAQAAYVRDNPASTGDICATIFECLGIDPDMTVPDRSGRPLPIANGGRAIREILE